MDKKFTIQVEMEERWIPHFLAMLKYMQYCGTVGQSREVSLFADGDGDFRPKFEWGEKLQSNAEYTKDYNGNRMFDAG